MKRYVTAILGALALAPAAAAAAEPQYGLCRSQIVDYVARHFEAQVTHIAFDFNYEDGPILARGIFAGSGNQAVVYTDGCEGYHVFDLFGTYFDCEHRAHYGTPRNYIRYRTSHGDCRKVGD